jgi:hypothetical protein
MQKLGGLPIKLLEDLGIDCQRFGGQQDAQER